MEDCIHKNGLEGVITLIGPVDGAQKRSVLREADLFVLPSFTENFGIAAAEAMAHGVPVITTVGTPWKEIGDRKCGWWIEIGVSSLAEALLEATTMNPNTLNNVGLRAQKYVQSKYAWAKVASQMKEVYQKILR